MARARKEGEAYVDVHANTDPFVREAEAGVREGAERAEHDLKETGDQWGETLSDALGERLEKEGPHLARSLEKGIGSQKVNVPIKPDYHTDRSATRKLASKLASEIEEAVLEAGTGGGGGPFGKLGQAFADAIGAGFNVSGKSPLITFLIPLVGAIVGLVIAAIQVVNALVAVLVTVPGLIAAIAFQAGVLIVAFQGVGTAIQGAFAAKNAKELKLALKDLAPAAQDFVKSLLPLKDFFYQLRLTTQQNFFKAFGDDLVPELLKFQGNRILHGFQELAKALGTFFHDLGFFFNSDAFAKFLDEVFPRTIDFLERFGPSFITFLKGLIDLANAAMPFMSDVGGILSMVFEELGKFFTETANDPAFQVWLEDMRDTLDKVVTLIGVAFYFVGQLMDSINKAGGEDLITQLALSLAMIADFLSTEVGQKAMETFIDLAIGSIILVTGLILAILAIAGAIQYVAEYIANNLIGDIGRFFVFLGGYIMGFFNEVGQAIIDFWNWLVWVFTGGINETTVKFKAFGAYLTGWVTTVKNWFASIPDRVKEVFSNAINFLKDAGRKIIEGLINGVREKFGDLRNALGSAGGIIAGFFPHSPAKEGPLSGKGDPLIAGQTIVNRLATGMEMEAPRLGDASAVATSNITFGPNSIQMRFSGIPSPDQARTAGGAVAEGISSGLARDTRLAVRTL